MNRNFKSLLFLVTLVGGSLTGCTAATLTGLAGPTSEVTIQDSFRWMRQNHDERYDSRALQWELVKEKVQELRKDGKYDEAIAALQEHYPKLVTEQAIKRLFESGED